MSGKRGQRQPTRLLRDYRWVHEHPEAEGGSSFQKVLQKLLREKPLEFMDRYQRAEQAHRSGKGSAAPGAPEAPAAPAGPSPEELDAAPGGANDIDRLLDSFPAERDRAEYERLWKKFGGLSPGEVMRGGA